MYKLMRDNWLMSVGLMKPFLVKMKVAEPEKIDSLHQELVRDWNDPEFCGYYHLCSLAAMKAKE